MMPGDLAIIHSPVAMFAFARRQVDKNGNMVQIKLDHGVPVVYLEMANDRLLHAFQQPLVMIFAMEEKLLIDKRFLRAPDV